MIMSRDERMTQAESKRLAPDDGPRKTPETDPTNPYHQEALGIFVPAAQTAERKINQPGLQKKDRDSPEPNV